MHKKPTYEELEKRVQKLEREQNFLKQLMETSPVGITVVNREGQIKKANAKAEKILGLKRSDICTRLYKDPAWHITDLDGNPYPEDQLPFQLVKGKSSCVYGVEHAIVWPNNKRVLLSINASPFFDQHGDFDGMVAALSDITDQRKMLKSLEESEKKYRTLVEGVPGIIYSYSTKSGGIYYNSQVQSVLGYSVSSLLENPKLWHDSIHPEDLKRVNKIIHNFQTEISFEVEYRIKNAKGKWLWFYDKSIGRITDGEEIIIEGIATDITDRKLAENKLLESDRNMSTVLNNTQDAVVRIDRGFRNIFANPSLYSATGLTPEQYLGKTNEEIGLPENLCAFWRKKHKEVFSSGQTDYFEFSFDTVNKGKKVFQAAVCPDFNANNEVETIISFMRDITKLKEVESEKDALIAELKLALAKIKRLEGFLPICSYCKKIRDDKGSWQQIEEYIRERSDAEFSHSICPECAKKHYPDLNL